MNHNFLGLHRPSKVFALLILSCLSALCAAHPADEFCNEDGMDPLLCAELAKLDNPNSDIDTASDKSDWAVARVGSDISLDRSAWASFSLYLKLGFEHILPMGLDHLLFVLALLLVSRSLRLLLLQISCFTLAHSITLLAASVGWINLPSQWIEMLIAVSIVVVALENILMPAQSGKRLLIIFIFGLLHGLGFAGALGELGLPSNHFFAALLGFNLGVELGQLVFAAAVFALLWYFINKPNYKAWVIVPGSLGVAAIALFWIYQRSQFLFY